MQSFVYLRAIFKIEMLGILFMGQSSKSKFKSDVREEVGPVSKASTKGRKQMDGCRIIWKDWGLSFVFQGPA